MFLGGVLVTALQEQRHQCAEAVTGEGPRPKALVGSVSFMVEMRLQKDANML